MRMNENRKRKKEKNGEHESNVNSYGNSKCEWIKIEKKLGEIINCGLIDNNKNKWEWMKIGKKKKWKHESNVNSYGNSKWENELK